MSNGEYDVQVQTETLRPTDTPKTIFYTIWGVLREIIEILLLGLIVWLAVNTATARYVVDGSSMEPNLHTGQLVLVSRMIYWTNEPARGDIIVFQYPRNPDESYVKRIIGIPGDEIRIVEGRVYVNGVLLDELYLDPALQIRMQGEFTATVPAGNYFVLGDNRASSSDSRTWGMLSEEYITGKAWMIYWPLLDLSVIEHVQFANLDH